MKNEKATDAVVSDQVVGEPAKGPSFTDTFGPLVGTPFAQQLAANAAPVNDDELPLNDWIIAGDIYQTTRVYTLDNVRKACRDYLAHMLRKMGWESYVVNIHKFGKSGGPHEYEMTDGSIATLSEQEALASAAKHASSIKAKDAEIAELRAKLAQARAAAGQCDWKLDDPDNGIWQSACGEAWSFVDGGPVENRVRHCQGCGKAVNLLADPKCWSCHHPYTAEQRADADGHCPQCGVEISLDAAPSADDQHTRPACRNQGGICACRSGGSFGGCALERSAGARADEKEGK